MFDNTRTWFLSRSLIIVIALGSLASTASAGDDQPIRRGDHLVFPEGYGIPRNVTDVERRYLKDHPLGAPRGFGRQPSGPIHCVAEYEPMEALLMAWEGSTSWKDILKQMAAHVTTTGDANVYMVVDSASEQTSAYGSLSAGGVDMNRVDFVVRPTDTIWIRDYGPRYIYEGQCRAIIDHTYNRPRPLDNALNAYFSIYKNHAYYEIPLVHGGGNYHLNALGDSIVSRLINAENPNLTEQQIHDLWLSHQNVDTTFFDPLPNYVDSTQHIDMWTQIIADDAIVISDWPYNSGSTQDQICDAAAALFASAGYTVHRVPARSVAGTHYTYTNVTMCNDLVLVPTYTNAQVVQHNAEALAVWEAALPDKTIVALNCQAIVTAAGVMHCIVMHVPLAADGGNPTVYLKNLRGGDVLEPGLQVEIVWISDDDVAVTNIDILLSIDGGATFPITIVSATADDGSHLWTVPDAATTQARLQLVAHDEDGNSGTDQSDDDFTIECTVVVGDLDGDGVVGMLDLLTLLAAWGPCAGCPADLDDDGTVGILDLLTLLANWGPCP